MPNINWTGNYEETPIQSVLTAFFEDRLRTEEKTVFVDADLMLLSGMKELWKAYPDRVLNTGIMEANLVGLGAGLSLAGLTPYIHSFAAFVTRRAFDQLFISAAYGDSTLHVIGSEPGIKQDFNGGTHMNFEDVAMMRTIPNATIIDITDSAMLKSVLEKTAEEHGIFYYRTPMAEIVKVYEDCSDIQIGKGIVLRDGSDASIIASGALVSPALEAAEKLEEEGISVRVVDMFTIKPLDEDLVVECASKTGAIVTAENASVRGGLGEAVSACVTEKCPAVVKHIAVKDEFGEVGPEEYLFKRYGFTAENIVRTVKEAMSMKER